MAPPVIDLHQRLDPPGVHPFPDGVLLLGVAPNATWFTHTGSPLPSETALFQPSLLAGAMQVEERDAVAIAQVVERVPEEAAVLEGLDLRVHELEAHQILVEVIGRRYVPARVGDVVNTLTRW